MSEAHLDEMGIDVDRVVAAVDFLEGYAAYAVSELSESAGEAQWTSAVDAATALREAAQWALCYDPLRARQLLDSSGDLFLAVEQPFGSYLKVVAGSWFEDPSVHRFGRQLAALASLNRPAAQAADVEMPSPLLHPQQQAYLMLAATAAPRIADEFRAQLREMTETSAHRVGVVPVGALGTPIREFWRMARLLLGPSNNAHEYVAELVSLAGRYSESLDLARTNDYCWRNAASAVDVGDIDIVGMTVIAARHYGTERVADDLAERAAPLASPGRALLEIAMEYVRAEEAPLP